MGMRGRKRQRREGPVGVGSGKLGGLPGLIKQLRLLLPGASGRQVGIMKQLGWGCREIRQLWKAQLISSRRGESAGIHRGWALGVKRAGPADALEGLLVGFGVEGSRGVGGNGITEGEWLN